MIRPHNYTVKKRDNLEEVFSLDKIVKRLSILADTNPCLNVDTFLIVKCVIENGIYNGISTTEIDNIAAAKCYELSLDEPIYQPMSIRIAISNIYKNTPPTFSKMMQLMHNANMINPDIYEIVNKNSKMLDECIVDSRDYKFDYFGLRTLEQSYLLVLDGKIVERPQYLWLRCALEIHRDDLVNVKDTYEWMSMFMFTHATPTLFNSCLRKNQLSSCMLLTNESDSIEGIYETLRKVSILGASAAGIGLSVSNIRATGSIIKSTGRPSKGLPPFLTIHNHNTSVIDQGGKRRMSVAIYIEPWHADFINVIDMASNENLSGYSARELFYAIWNNNVLVDRVKNNQPWSFFCPTEAPKLLTTYGEEFRQEYEKYEAAGLARSTIDARELYVKIATLMAEVGGPFHLNKDACNFKSNMKNVSIINCSNLCTEILIPSGDITHNGKTRIEIGVCTLASISLSGFVTACKWDNEGNIVEPGEFDFAMLHQVAGVVCRNLNKVVDNQYYPLDECLSNRDHRPIGIGVQGLADVFMMLGYPYESPEAVELDWRIAEEIYHGALTASMELAEKHGPYMSFEGSPASQGILQPHLWQQYSAVDIKLPYKYDWDKVGEEVKTRKLRNALMVAYMPTASTSQIFGNYSAFEPAISNAYTRRTLAGNFTLINKYLSNILNHMGLWNNKMRDSIIAANGSIANIKSIPDNIKEIFKTCWDMSTKNLMNMSANRGQFICHTQSLNLFIKDPTIERILKILAYGMHIGLKTIAYYTRSQAAREAVKVTIARNPASKKKKPSKVVCSGDACITCQS